MNGQYKSVFDSVSDGILILNQRGQIEDANPAALNIYEYGYKELVGTPAANLFRGRDFYKFSLCMDRARRLHKSSKFKAVHETKTGESIHALVQAKLFRQSGRRGIILIVRDNTQREYTENRLRKAKLEAEASDVAKSQFLANISHEIRTPMNVILGYADLLRDERLEPGLRAHFVKSILNNGDSLIKLIDRLLDISNAQVGGLSVEKDTFSLYPALRELVKQVKSQVGDKSIEFTLDYRLSEDVKIKTDPIRFKQVLANLLNNAVKFTQEGKVSLAVFCEEGARVKFQVIDTGIGIPKQEWKRLFNPFSQMDTSITREFGGVGLGLAVSKHLAQALGGNLYLKKSLPKRGSTFEFWLGGDSLINYNSEGSFEALKSANILLVEDVKENQALIKMYLRQMNCRLDIAGDGQEALDMLASNSYDLILMDLQMPRLDGFGATHLIRKKGLDTPIIALTAHAMKEDVEKCMRSGFDAHLSKPVRSSELLTKVTKHCQAFK